MKIKNRRLSVLLTHTFSISAFTAEDPSLIHIGVVYNSNCIQQTILFSHTPSLSPC